MKFKDPNIVYKYCYECNVVLGKPDFTRELVAQEALEKHQGHCLAQSEHDRKHNNL